MMEIDVKAYEKRIHLKINQLEAADLATIMYEICDMLAYSAKEEERSITPIEQLQIDTCKEVYMQISEQAKKMIPTEIDQMREKHGHDYLIKQLLKNPPNDN